MKETDLKAAIFDRLRQLPDVISLYEFAPLVSTGFGEHEIVNTLFRLANDGVLELLPGNRLRVLKLPKEPTA